MKTTLEEFKKILIYHDWTYPWSDDPRDWVKGERVEREIRDTLEENKDNPDFFVAYEAERSKHFKKT